MGNDVICTGSVFARGTAGEDGRAVGKPLHKCSFRCPVPIDPSQDQVLLGVAVVARQCEQWLNAVGAGLDKHVIVTIYEMEPSDVPTLDFGPP